jgi:AcrR family transcriptional regulator
LRFEFENLVDQARAIMSGNLESIDSGRSTSPLRKASNHLLIAAHRFDELRDVVPFDVQRVLFEHESDETGVADRTVFRAVIGWLLGIALEPGRRESDTLALLRHIGWADGIWRNGRLAGRAKRMPPLPLVFEEVGDMSQEILGACTRIVARGGFSRATLARIARMSGYPPEVLYGMYGRQEYLIAQYMRSVFALLFSFTRFEQFRDSPAQASMRLGVWLEPDMHIRRRALLESVMASNFSPLLESAFFDAAEVALTDMRLAHLGVSELRTEVDRLRFLASRQITLGLALLDDVEVERWDRDWDPFLQVLFSSDG